MAYLEVEEQRRFEDKLTREETGCLESLLSFAKMLGSDQCETMIRFELNKRLKIASIEERIADIEEYLEGQTVDSLKGSYQQRRLYELDGLKCDLERLRG